MTGGSPLPGRALSGGRMLLLAAALALVTIAWEHAYHSVATGSQAGIGAHTLHVLRDALLALPLAAVALVAGLRFTRARSAAIQATGVSLVLALLLVPGAAVHEWIDGGQGHAGHVVSGFVGQIQHGVQDALIAQVVALPLLLLALGAVDARRSWPRIGAVAAAAAASTAMLVFGGGSAHEAAVASGASVHEFHLTDNPGNWFDSGSEIAGTRSLVVAHPGDRVRFTVDRQHSGTVHTATSLAFPAGAAHMPFDQPQAFKDGSREVELHDPGLYVFVCKLHPFMLGSVVVDDPATPELDLGHKLSLVSGATVPTASNLGLRLARAFFVITNPANYQRYSSKTSTTWDPTYPPVPVRAFDKDDNPVSIPNLDDFLGTYFHEPVTLPKATPPAAAKGVGEVWVDTEYELTAHKTKPGAATAVDASRWQITKKFAFPTLDFNNGHNMWASRDQETIFNTEWFGNRVLAFNRRDGRVKSVVEVGEAPAHVMTRTDTDQPHVTLNGENAVVELTAGARKVNRRLLTQRPGELPAQPHAHSMGPDGHTMATPNSNTNDSTLLNVPGGTITSKVHTGTLPIASGMMPDASKYYVSNYADSTISVVDMAPPQHVTKTIDLLANYDPITGAITGPLGGLPIQTPVSPNGKYVVTANTLTATITIIDTDTDELVKSLPCDAGCHGVNFGAKKGGGYLVYVSSKFSNTLIVLDPDPNDDGDATDATILGRVVLDGDGQTETDDRVVTNTGMGGQGVLPIPLVYNGWVQKVPRGKFDLTCAQRHPLETPCKHER